MEVTITKADKKYLDDCKIALLNSRLGQEYFASEEKTISALTEGMTRGEMFVAINEKDECLGFLWYIAEGAFHSFPYLHIIAIKEEFRGLGVGKKLLSFFEKIVFVDHSKTFLVVGDFNPDAKRLYENLGYRQVGAIPNLYKVGVTEYLMMKEKPITNE
jgi:ribosomal protein S18 acetylase RimI-like enzyme